MMMWIWKDGIPKLDPPHSSARLCLMTGINAIPEEVPCISHHVGFRTLSVFLSPSGSQKKQIAILRAYSIKYFTVVTALPCFLQHPFNLG